MPRLPISASSLGFSSRPVMRLLLVAMLFFGLGGAALAGQIDPGDAKDSVEEDASATPEVSPGLVAEGDYESPQFGTGITWTDAWDLGDFDNPLVEFAVGGNFDAPITSDPVTGDALWLMDTASESAVLGIFLVPNDGNTPAIMVQQMGQSRFLSQNLFVPRDSDRLLLEETETTATILVRDADVPEHLIYLEVIFPEGEDYFVWVGFDLWEPDAYEGVFADVADGLEIDGVDPFSAASTDELLELIDDPNADTVTPDAGNATPDAETTPEQDETPDAEPTEEGDGTPAAVDGSSGLIGEGEYESPQHGAGITWADSWVLDETQDQPVSSDEGAGVDALFLTDEATGNAMISIRVEELPSSDPADLLSQIAAADYNETVLGIDPESRVLLSEATDASAAILVVDNSGEEPLVIVLEAHALNDDGLVAFVEFRAVAAEIDEPVLTALVEDLEVEGTPGLTVFTVEELLVEVAGI
ncbi:MAG: hypothetical protein H0W23_00065 [Chloroflexia bacterium]|nr:hypothetical protein [Chloroflexia bacterium]